MSEEWKMETPGPYEARTAPGGVPADPCPYGVVSLTEGREVCRVWREQDARAIAAILSALDITPAPSPDAIAAAPGHVSEEMLDAAMRAYHGADYDGRLRGCSAEVGEGAREEMRAAIAAILSLLKEEGR